MFSIGRVKVDDDDEDDNYLVSYCYKLEKPNDDVIFKN